MRSSILSFAFACGLVAAADVAQAEAPAMFLPRAGAADVAASGRVGVVRVRRVEIVQGALDRLAPPLPSAGAAVRLDLFDDVVLEARIDRVQALERGFSWAGRLEGQPLGDVVLASHDGVLTGSVVWPGGAYRIGHDGRGAFVEEIDEAQFPDGPCFVDSPRPPAASGADRGLDRSQSADDGSLVEVLVAFTPAAREGAGGEAGIRSLIDTAIAETNQGYANSGVVQRLHLASAVEVVYAEADIGTDLGRLRDPDDGFMDEVRLLRDASGADVVSLLGVGYAAQGYCGMAYLMAGNDPGFGEYAYSVVDATCATGYYSFGHELGHNMGLNHARSDPTGRGAFGYSYGYKDPGAAFRTVMAYACENGAFCPRILHFSNPAVAYDARPTGVPETEAGSADNARSLNETRVTVASWRDGPCTYTLVPPGGSVGPAAGSGRLAVTASAAYCSWTATSLDAAITVTSGASGIGGGEVSYSYAPNGAGPRTLRLLVGGQTFWVDQEGAVCRYALDATGAVLPAAGGEGTVAVLTGYWCPWQVAGAETWISWRLVTRALGEGLVRYTVAPNDGPSRSATLTIAGQTFVVVQNAASCTAFTVAPASLAAPVFGGSGEVTVAGQAWCSWSATASVPWIRVTSGGNGSGPGRVGYTVLANTSPEARTGTLTVAGQAVMVVQPGQPPGPWHEHFAVDPLETPAVGDFDGDGRTDLITFTRQNPRALGDVYVALSNGTHFVDARGVPDSSTKWHDWFAVSGDERVLIGDFDGDGRDDVATWLAASTRQVYVALSRGSGMGRESVWIERIGRELSDVLAAGDVDGDGRDDLVLFARASGTVEVALSTRTAFAAARRWHGFFAVSRFERPCVADVNGDGRADIVTFATDSPTARGDVYVALSDGTEFVDASGIPGSSTKWHDWFAVDPTQQVRVGDRDGDGLDDFFTFLPAPFGQVYTVRSEATGLGPNVLWPDAVPVRPTDVPEVGDVNGDGKADVIVFARTEGKVRVWLGR